MDTNDRLNQVISENENLKVKLRNQDAIITANLGFAGQVRKAAFDLGYHDSMDTDELEYLISKAKAGKAQ